jgi:dTMP kinase
MDNQKKKSQKGKFIVVEGIDGSGKATQTKLLFQKLKKEKFKVKKIDFPQYKNNFFGSFIGECLAGEHGNFLKLDARIASVLYAADRFESSQKINNWIKQGYFVIADRYVSANQIHQGGKITDEKKREKFIKWLDKMEFGIFKLPRPQLVLYLDVPVKISQTLLEGREGKGEKNTFKGVRKGKDLYERSVDHLAKARRSAANMAEGNNNWKRINCATEGQIMPRQRISELVWQAVKNRFRLK